jgi:hypothetical protein
MLLPPTVTSLGDGTVVDCAKAGPAMRKVVKARVLMSVFILQILVTELHMSGEAARPSLVHQR